MNPFARTANLSILLFAVAALSFGAGCKHPLVEKKRVQSFNEARTGVVFLAEKDIQFWQNGKVDPARPLFKKGTRLEIVLETGDDWMRVRARDLSRSIEQNPGEIIVFYVWLAESGTTGEQALEQVTGYLDAILKPARGPGR